MASREEIAEALRDRFETVKERGKILAHALKVRADIAAARRRLRNAYADLGEEVYRKMSSGPAATWTADADLADYQRRIDGVQAELRQRERALEEVMAQRRAREVEVEVPVEGAEDFGSPTGRRRPSGGPSGEDIGQGT